MSSEILKVIVPIENVNDEFAKITDWNFANGDQVEKGEVLIDLETAKAAFDIDSPGDGYLYFLKNEGDQVKMGTAVAVISSTELSEDQVLEYLAEDDQDGSNELRNDQNATAKAIKLSQAYGIQLSDLGIERTIKAEDVLNWANEKGIEIKIKKFQQNNFVDSEPLIQSVEGADKVEQSATKLFEIKELTASYANVIPSSVTTQVEVAKVNAKLKLLQEEYGPGITQGELILWAIGQVLPKFKDLNATFKSGKMFGYNDINIGFAVNIGKGLKVPVISSIDGLTVKDVSNKVKELSMSYFRDELKISDLTGGTFTITDLSSMNITNFSPVINNFQGAILGVCSVDNTKNWFNLILNFDHRLTDGMYAAQALSQLKKLIEEA